MREHITPAQLTTWRLFITAHATLIEQIDRELAAAGCVPLHWYDVLVELYEAPDRRLRMAELARRVVLSRSSLTHLADRLEREGLLRRARVDTDRRGAYAVLSEQGEQALRRAWPIYARGIVQHFIRHLTDEELQSLTDIFQRLLMPATPVNG
ncbi:MAG TPA: MarR family transcriptional regulator [Gemmatimonadaceae bacterium]|nr:MarR family transcriptional regulator [Gemmatimonadaceae bacterium]